MNNCNCEKIRQLAEAALDAIERESLLEEAAGRVGGGQAEPAPGIEIPIAGVGTPGAVFQAAGGGAAMVAGEAGRVGKADWSHTWRTIFFASLAIMSLYGFWYASSAHLRATVERLAADFDRTEEEVRSLTRIIEIREMEDRLAVSGRVAGESARRIGVEPDPAAGVAPDLDSEIGRKTVGD